MIKLFGYILIKESHNADHLAKLEKMLYESYYRPEYFELEKKYKKLQKSSLKEKTEQDKTIDSLIADCDGMYKEHEDLIDRYQTLLKNNRQQKVQKVPPRTCKPVRKYTKRK